MKKYKIIKANESEEAIESNDIVEDIVLSNEQNKLLKINKNRFDY